MYNILILDTYISVYVCMHSTVTNISPLINKDKSF